MRQINTQPTQSTTPTGDRTRDAKQYRGGADKPEAEGRSSGQTHHPKGKPGEGGQSLNGDDQPETREARGLVDPRRETGRDILGPAEPPQRKTELAPTPGDADAPLEIGRDG